MNTSISSPSPRFKRLVAVNLCGICGRLPVNLKVSTRCTKCVKNPKRWRKGHFFGERAKVFKLKHADSTIREGEIYRLWIHQRGKCALTGQVLTGDAQLDHIEPRVRNGANSIENLWWVCRAVNQAKHTLSVEEFVSLCQQVVALSAGTAHE